jgi:hypothetical protein
MHHNAIDGAMRVFAIRKALERADPARWSFGLFAA